ncbi:MAG: exodeoxyribonuclease VII small subunit [Paludibacteraceae bacterium]|nr:exodeoxyribonuclease VII small subunit [Paludibacteraceae bacterium]
MQENLSYDESLKRVEEIVSYLEGAEAISMEEYKKLAAEATSLLNRCKQELDGLVEQVH